MDNDPRLQELADLIDGKGHGRYGLHDVTQRQHALQAAWQAEREGCSSSLIAAALLHDIGHMVHDLGDNPAAHGVDDRHEELGQVWLQAWFGPEVTEPVRLHVAAKRYLCTVEPDYYGKLSDDSIRSLKLQGGLMSPDEVAAFRANPWHAEAVRLRRFDEEAKDPRAVTPDFDHYLRHVAACSRA